MSVTNPCPLLLGTAGHIDHGKTSLVYALTQIDTDKLVEEKLRGITIELGFAFLDTSMGRIGFVDMPGHERFLKTMVAGASGIDIVLLVVDAKEGIMPQTREHLDVCHLLGVRQLLIVITKCDLVDKERIETLKKTLPHDLKIPQAPVFAISSKTNEGINQLKQGIEASTQAISPRTNEGLFRMPIDRVFSLKGFGTIVTGSIFSGKIVPKEELLLLPAAKPIKIRTIQTHGIAAHTASAGTRCALNITGVDYEDIHRGDWIADAAIKPSLKVDVRFHCLETSDNPMAIKTSVLIHHGTAQIPALLLLPEIISQGQTSLAQLHFHRNTSITALPHDRFLVRLFHKQKNYGTTIGGGTIIRVHAQKLNLKNITNTIKRFENASLDERIELEILSCDHLGIYFETLSGKIHVSKQKLVDQIKNLLELEKIFLFQQSYYHHTIVLQLQKNIVEHLNNFYQKKPTQSDLSRTEIANTFSLDPTSPLFLGVLNQLEIKKKLQFKKNIVQRLDYQETFSALEMQLLEKFKGFGLTPPSLAILAEQLKTSVSMIQKTLDKLASNEHIYRINLDIYIDKETIIDLQTRLLTYLDEQGTITMSQWKTLSNVSRKYAVPLAEFFDAQKVTLRVGAVRKKRT